jgi:CRISPR-associated protein Cas2
LYVISYDVVDDARRRRIHDALKDYGRRVQFSVFECHLDEKGLAELWDRIGFELNIDEDSCRFYRLCGACEPEVRILGQGDRYVLPGHLIV